MILDGTLKDGEYKLYEDLGNGWAKEIKTPISAYGSIDVDELNKTIERLNKIPDYNTLMKENNRLNNIINEAMKIFKENYYKENTDFKNEIEVDEIKGSEE